MQVSGGVECSAAPASVQRCRTPSDTSDNTNMQVSRGIRASDKGPTGPTQGPTTVDSRSPQASSGGHDTASHAAA